MDVEDAERADSDGQVLAVSPLNDVSKTSEFSTAAESVSAPSDVFRSVSVTVEVPELDLVKSHVLVRESKDGLLNVKAVGFLCLWYVFSAATLFSNKYILSTLNGNPTLLGCSQILTTTVCGFIQLRFCTTTRHRSATGSRRFICNMILLGTMRFMTIILGLIALKFVTISFTETIKSSAPIFTVIIAWLILRQSTEAIVVSSLLPIMAGLALTSAYELSFNIIGFLAAMTNNITDCLQNVYSKLLISGTEHEVQPAELQFYTSIASVALQIPLSYFVIDFPQTRKDLNSVLVTYLLLNGLFFHLQSLTAYSLMAFISPVTHSVANTVKRALLIWISVLVFNNPVSFLSGVGMVLVSFGVFLYNKAQHYALHRAADADASQEQAADAT